MRVTPIRASVAVAAASALILAACTTDASEEPTDGPDDGATEDDAGAGAELDEYEIEEVDDGTTTFVVVRNPGDGPTLSYAADSNVEILEEEIDGRTYAFKDMNGNGELDVWEDWREDSRTRAEDLAGQLSIEQVAGLMLFSSHERDPRAGLTDAQQEYLQESRLRNVLNAGPNEVDHVVGWVNEMQAYVETLASDDEPYIPVNFSSDPRSTAGDGAAYDADGDISRWPSNLGLASTFDVEHMRNFAEMASAEYRAMGITTALSPQIDLATEPRWLRVEGTFGENADLAIEMAQAYVEGFQGTAGQDEWGSESVAAMIKHYAGDGPGEGGRESHTSVGQYGVYPGDNFDEHASVFLAALDAAAVMTAYSIAVDGEGEPLFGERVGTAYDQGRMDILREDNSYEGVVVTDWAVTRSMSDPDTALGTGWGAEDLSIEERHFEIIRTGHDMFGGNNDVEPVLAAYDLWQEAYEAGELDMDADERWALTGERVLNLIFNAGLYESPYLDPEESEQVVASQDRLDAGFEAQLDSAVLLKNEDAITETEAGDWSEQTVYIPRSFDFGHPSFGEAEYTEGPTMDLEVAEEYFGTVVTDEYELDENEQVTGYTAPDLSDVDVVVVGMRSPDNGNNFSYAGLDRDEDTWYPLSLQWRPYTADGPNVREVSIAGDIVDGEQENRSYFGETSRISNEADLDAFERAVEAVEASGQDIPILVVVKANNPVVPTEFEEQADAVIAAFGISDQAALEVALGLHEPQGRLPIGFPASMDAVEAQLEDVGEDHETYVDSAGNDWSFGFGLNWSGLID
ncbi:glycoside hydrolase family 3 protein [Bogoriella caseilytica]|uniref:beta-glucosidase n=1 Tax=Bogoriella caseilytica TaxID=56055 RepID=A0A3N2BF74_9MICO|nr:glycoside hydrolase family 3 N-terminal domain-containing protein [Bogoriella caseilytica]ROR73902.1 beta-glucosidase [Bogoriella caseilytica]